MKIRKPYCRVEPYSHSICFENQVINIDTSVESIQTGQSSGALDASQFMGKPGEPVHLYKSFDLSNKPYDPTLNSFYIEKSKQRINGNNNNNNKTE